MRTVGRVEARYNPDVVSQRLGLAARQCAHRAGLCPLRAEDQVLRLFQGMFDAAVYMDLRRLPELFCGFPRVAGKGPTSYPVACSPQAWAAAAPLPFCRPVSVSASIRKANGCASATRDCPNSSTRLSSDLRVGDSSQLGLMLRRYGADVWLNVLDRSGDGRIAITL